MEDEKLVEWNGVDDKEDIRNAGSLKKWCITLLVSVAAGQFTLASSVLSTSSDLLQEKFHTSHEMVAATTALWVFALALCPLVAGPASETFGRKPVYIVSYVGYVVFQFPSAFGKNIQSVLAGRFLCSLMGGTALSNTPATVNDIWSPDRVATFLNINSMGAFIGPGVGPLVGGFANLIGVRWPMYIMLMWSGVLLVLLAIMPETYAPVLKARKAKRLRKETGDTELYAAFEKQQGSFLSKLSVSCLRPFNLFIKEPMLMVLCFYQGFLLSTMYFFTVSFPIVFSQRYGFNNQQVGLSFLGVIVGMLCGAALVPMFERLRRKRIARRNGKSVPELVLPQMCFGSVVIPIGLFMFAWTIYPSIHWMVPIVAAGVYGMGCYLNFNSIMSYTVQAYSQYAASAMSANVSLRCLMGGAFPLFGAQMMEGMGHHWALTFMGCISLVLLPSPFVFIKYGALLRSKSKFAA